MAGIIPNVAGRVEGSDGSIEAGVYVVGWLKRGPSGIIGTNLTDAEETVNVDMGDIDTLIGCQLQKSTMCCVFCVE